MGTIQDKLVYLNKYKKEFIKALNDKGILLRQDATLSQVMYAVYFYYKIRIFDKKMKVWKASYFPLDGHDIFGNINIVKLKEAYRTATGRELDISIPFTYNKTSSLDDKFEMMKKWKLSMTNLMKSNPSRKSAINTDASLDNMVREFMKELDFVIPPLKIPDKIKKKDVDQEIHFKDAQPNMVVNMEGQDFSYILDEGIKGIAKPHPPRFKIPVIYKTKYGKEINRGFITIQGNLDWVPEVYMFNRGKLFTETDNRNEMLMVNKPDFFDPNEEAFGLFIKFPEEIERKIEDENWIFLLGIFEVDEQGEPKYSQTITMEYVDKNNYKSNLLAFPYYRQNHYGGSGSIKRINYGTLQEGHVFYRNSHTSRPNIKYEGVASDSSKETGVDSEARKAYTFGSEFSNGTTPLKLDTKFTLFSERNSGSKIAIQLFQLSRKVNLPITDMSQYAHTAEDAIHNVSRDGGPKLFDMNNSALVTEPIIVDCEKATIKNAPYFDSDNIPTLQKIEDGGILLFGFDEQKDDWRIHLFFAALIGISVPYIAISDIDTNYMKSMNDIIYPGINFPDIRDLDSFNIKKNSDGRYYLKIPMSYYVDTPEISKSNSVYPVYGSLKKFSIKFHFRNHIFKNDSFLNNEKIPFTGDKKILKIHKGQIIKLFTSHFVHPSDLIYYRDIKGLRSDIVAELSSIEDEQRRKNLFDPVRKMLKQYYTGGFNTESITVNGNPLSLNPKSAPKYYITDGAITTISIEIPEVIFLNKFFEYNYDIKYDPYYTYFDNETMDYPLSLEDKNDLSFLDMDSPNYFEFYGVMNTWYWLIYLLLSYVTPSTKPVFTYRTVNNFKRMLKDIFFDTKEEDIQLILSVRQNIIDWISTKINTYFEFDKHNISLQYTSGGHPLLRMINNRLYFIYSIRNDKETDRITFNYAMKILKSYTSQNNLQGIFKIVEVAMNEKKYLSQPSQNTFFENDMISYEDKNGKIIEYRLPENSNISYLEKCLKSYKVLPDTPDNPFMGYSYPANYVPTTDKQREQIEKNTHILYYDMTWSELIGMRGDVDINNISKKYPGLVDETKHGEKSIIIRVFIDKKNNGTALVPDGIPVVDFEGGKYPDYSNSNFWDKYIAFCTNLRTELLKEGRYFKNVICLILGVGIDNTGYDYVNKKYIRIQNDHVLRNGIQTSPTNNLYKTNTGLIKNFWIALPMATNEFDNIIPSTLSSSAVIQNLVVFNAPLGDKTKFEEWVDACYLGTKKMLDDGIYPHLGRYSKDKNMTDLTIGDTPLKCSANKYTIGTLPENVNDLIEDEEYFSELLRQFKTINPMFVIGFIDRERHPEKYQLLLNEMGYKLAISGTESNVSANNRYNLDNLGKNPYYTFNTKSRLVPREFIVGKKTGNIILNASEDSPSNSSQKMFSLYNTTDKNNQPIEFITNIFPEGTFSFILAPNNISGMINGGFSNDIANRLKEEYKFDIEENEELMTTLINRSHFFSSLQNNLINLDCIFKLGVGEKYSDISDRLYIKLANHKPNTFSLNLTSFNINPFFKTQY